jgi:hypothetical protein
MGNDIEIIDGVLTKPDLHDACIFGLNMSENEGFTISIRLENGVSVDFILSRASRLLVNNFREGNIILDVVVLHAGEVEVSDIEKFYESNSADISAVVLALHHRVKLDGKILVKISSSYGCEITCICDGIGFVKGAV